MAAVSRTESYDFHSYQFDPAVRPNRDLHFVDMSGGEIAFVTIPHQHVPGYAEEQRLARLALEGQAVVETGYGDMGHTGC